MLSINAVKGFEYGSGFAGTFLFGSEHNDAFYTDVRPALAQWRESRGLPADPLAAFKASGYQKKINEDRVGGQQAGWGA